MINAFDAAIARWEEVIIGDLSDQVDGDGNPMSMICQLMFITDCWVEVMVPGDALQRTHRPPAKKGC